MSFICKVTDDRHITYHTSEPYQTLTNFNYITIRGSGKSKILNIYIYISPTNITYTYYTYQYSFSMTTLSVTDYKQAAQVPMNYECYTMVLNANMTM